MTSSGDIRRSHRSYAAWLALLTLAVLAGVARSANALELRMAVEFVESGNSPQYIDAIRLVQEEPPPPKFPQYVNEDGEGGWFASDIPLPPPGARYLGLFSHRVRRDSRLVVMERLVRTSFCFLIRDGDVEPAYAALACREGGSCTRHASDPGGIELCDTHERFDWSGFGLIRSANANTGSETGTVWDSPSLATIESTDFLRNEGYTRFRIRASSLPPLAADSVTAAVFANGMPIFIDSLAPEQLPQPYDPARPLEIRFALQNLDFAGVSAGCDRIRVDLTFLMHGEPVKRYRLERTYVALRDAPPYSIGKPDGTRFDWDGRYLRPPQGYDHEVFLLSGIDRRLKLRFGEQPDAVDRRRIERLKAGMDFEKRRFDRLRLDYAGQRVVGVIRPPLTQYSYGLALGLRDAETGQVRFTFDRATARRLKDWLMRQRTSNPRLRAIVPHDPFVYAVNKEVPPPTVCEPLS